MWTDKDGDYVLYSDHETATKEAVEKAVKKERVRIVSGDFTQICSYCGEELQGKAAWSKLQEHVAVCPKHPLSVAKKRIAELESGAVELKEKITVLTKGKVMIDDTEYCCQQQVSDLLLSVSLERDEISATVKRLEEAVQFTYRKHHMGDDSIGWDELSDILLHALCEAMGDKGFQDWLAALTGRKCVGG
jgi:hypothetical protein